MTERQPQTNDFRRRIARPVYVQTLAAQVWTHADSQANDFSDLVTDAGGEVLDIRPLVERDTSGDYPTTYHLRIVTYRASSRIAP
jgi:hypothetical protein